MATFWTRADYDAATAHDAARRARDDARTSWETPMPPQTDPWADAHGQGATPRPWTPEDDASEAASLDDACDAVAGWLQTGRGNTTPTPTTPPTPKTPATLLETLIEGVGPEEAFRIWAMRRNPTPCQPELWSAQSAHRAAVEADKDAIASATEARLARRAAAADLAEARAAVAVQRARIARARVG